MMDRYSGWLNYKNSHGDILAESRGGEEDRQLKSAYKTVYESGTLMFSREHHQRALTSREIKIQPKSRDIAGLQLADILAFPVKQRCLADRGLIEAPGDVFGGKICELLAGKYNMNEWTGQVDGYGKVWLPRGMGKKMGRPV